MPHRLDKVQRRLAPVFEPGLAAMIANCDGLLHATLDIEKAVSEAQMTFVVVPTPSHAGGAFFLKCVCAAMEPIGRALRSKSGSHMVVLTSTVLPGSTEYVFKPLLEKISGKRGGARFCFAVGWATTNESYS